MQLFIEIKCERSGNTVHGGAEEGICEGNLCVTCTGSISLLLVQMLSSTLLRCREWCPLNHPPPHAAWLKVCSKTEKCLILELCLLPNCLIRPRAFAQSQQL